MEILVFLSILTAALAVLSSGTASGGQKSRSRRSQTLWLT